MSHKPLEIQHFAARNLRPLPTGGLQALQRVIALLNSGNENLLPLLDELNERFGTTLGIFWTAESATDPLSARYIATRFAAPMASSASFKLPTTTVAEEVRTRSTPFYTLLAEGDEKASLLFPLRNRDHLLGVIELQGSALLLAETVAGAEEEIAAMLELLRLSLALIQTEREKLARDQLILMAAHEIKTPLTSLLLHEQRLLRRMKAPEPVSMHAFGETLQLCERQTRKLVTLVDQVMNFAAFQVDRVSVASESFDLGELLSDLLRRYEPDATRVGCTFETHISEKLLGQWDPVRLDQALGNLIANAIKYAPGGPIEIRAYAIGDESVQVEIVDHGPGIAPEDQMRIFAQFERAPGVTRIAGLGLGLYLTRKIIERHGGEITLKSQVGNGSRFVITLPIFFRKSEN